MGGSLSSSAGATHSGRRDVVCYCFLSGCVFECSLVALLYSYFCINEVLSLLLIKKKEKKKEATFSFVFSHELVVKRKLKNSE